MSTAAPLLLDAADGTSGSAARASDGGGDGDARRGWLRRNGGLVALGVVAVLVAVAAALSAARGGGGALDPRSAAPQGSRAVASILADQGVEVSRFDRLDPLTEAATSIGEDATVLIVDTGVPLPADRLSRLAATGTDIVLVEPGFLPLDVLAPELVLGGGVDPDGAVAPACEQGDAAAAGAITGGGTRYVQAPPDTVPGGARDTVICYPADSEAGDEGGAYAVVSGDGTEPTVTVIGQSTILTNEALADRGNAALALRSLGRQPTLLWYLPDPLDPALARPEQAPDPLDLLPAWVDWVAAQLLVVTAVAVVWRFRRLGRLVPERLPAVVRSVETAEGRARLYRRSRARDRVAQLLRADTAHDLGARLGAPRGSTPAEVAVLVADAVGRPTVEVADILAGPVPADDAALARLARDLDGLVLDLTPSQSRPQEGRHP